MKKLVDLIKHIGCMAYLFRWYLIAIALIVFAYWAQYQIAVSNLPDWFKYVLLK